MELIDNNIAVSVIVPMYNVEKKVDRCLLSIASQSLKNIEVIFIDDKSRDNTLENVSAWIAEQEGTGILYKLVKQKANGGVAAARNAGLDNAVGKYIYNLDADDYMEPDTLYEMYTMAETLNADIVSCEWFLTFEKNERAMRQADVKTGDELFSMLAKGCMRWNLWLFLLKRSLIEDNHIRFIPGMNMGEDMMAVMELALHSNTVAVVHKPLYHYIQTNDAALTKNFKRSIPQVSANVAELERYIAEGICGRDKSVEINLLKLTLKQPLLISDQKEDYELWGTWFSEANGYIEMNDKVAFYSKFIQKVARAKQYWFLKLYYLIVIRFLYGVLYR